VEIGTFSLTWQHLLMLCIGGLLIYLGSGKKWEPLLLVPIGFGVILVNLPLGSSVMGFQMADGTMLNYLPPNWNELIIAEKGSPVGFLSRIFQYGFGWGIIPLSIFIGLGAMTDFGPLIARPVYFLLGAAAQLGVYCAFFLAIALGMSIPEAASIGIIGGADGPTTIYITQLLAPSLLGATAIAAYTYMAMVPLIQPPIIRAMCSQKERAIYMKPQIREVSHLEKILFPVMVTIIVVIFVPEAGPLIGMFMFGNLLKESGVTDRLANTAGTVFIDILTIFLGLCVGAYMAATSFLQPASLMVFGIGILAFVIATAGGVIFGKILNAVSATPVNPMIGAAGVSAVPMSARVVQRMGQKANPRNFLLMHAMGPNVAGVIGTATAAGVFISLLTH
jgi:oxaloacetate decarboxylase beta subunit